MAKQFRKKFDTGTDDIIRMAWADRCSFEQIREQAKFIEDEKTLSKLERLVSERAALKASTQEEFNKISKGHTFKRNGAAIEVSFDIKEGLIYNQAVDSTTTGIGSIIDQIPPSVGGSKKYDIRREENTICHFELERRLPQRYWRSAWVR